MSLPLRIRSACYLAVASTLLTLPCSALAHPGHGDSGRGTSLRHYASEPEHIAMFGGLVLVGAGVIYVAGKVIGWIRASDAKTES